VNDTLRRALADARLDEASVSTALGVDPKTVHRWIMGRTPQRRFRWDLADLVSRHEHDLWPELAYGAGGNCPEIRGSYPGVAVRILLGDPNSRAVADRGTAEGIGDALAAKIRNAIVLYRPLLAVDGIEIRLHDTVLYNSIFRADDELLANPHVLGVAASYAPVLHLCRSDAGDLVSTYSDSFDRVWQDAAPLKALRTHQDE
jgi:hypothetical protein